MWVAAICVRRGGGGRYDGCKGEKNENHLHRYEDVVVREKEKSYMYM